MITLIIILYILCIFGVAGIDSARKEYNKNIIADIIFYILFAWTFPLALAFAIGKFCAYIDKKINYERNRITI